MSSEALSPAEAPVTAPVAAPVEPKTFRFSYTADGTEFFLLVLKNVLLNILTLGIYSAWAKTQNRQFLWKHVNIAGHRLTYTGTGLELFLGYLKVFLGYLFILLPVIVTSALIQKEHPTLSAVLLLSLYLVIFLIIPFAIYWSRAYLMSRTTWRGLRFGMNANAKRFALTYWGGLILSILTLGLYLPFWENRLQKSLTENTRFGSQNFSYDGKGSELFLITFKGLILTVLTLGFYAFWMRAEIERYTLSHTQFMGARGHSELTGGTLLKVFLIYMVGTTMTFGIAFPWLLTYSLQTLLSKISFVGDIDFTQVARGAEVEGAASGDALADSFDVGMAF